MHRVWWKRLVLLPLLAAAAGCGPESMGYRVKASPPLPQETRERLTRVALVSEPEPQRLVIQVPNRRVPRGWKGAGVGAAGGAVFGLASAAGSGPFFPAFALFVVPITTTGGAIIGGATGIGLGGPTDEDEALAEQLREAARQTQITRSVEQALRATAEARTRSTWVVQEPPPAAPSPPASAADQLVMHRQRLSDSGYHAAVHLRVVAYGLALQDNSKKTAQAFVAIETRVVELPGGKEIYASIQDHLSEARVFSDWAPDHGKALQEELRQGAQQLVQQSLAEAFAEDR